MRKNKNGRAHENAPRKGGLSGPARISRHGAGAHGKLSTLTTSHRKRRRINAIAPSPGVLGHRLRHPAAHEHGHHLSARRIIRDGGHTSDAKDKPAGRQPAQADSVQRRTQLVGGNLRTGRTGPDPRGASSPARGRPQCASFFGLHAQRDTHVRLAARRLDEKLQRSYASGALRSKAPWHYAVRNKGVAHVERAKLSKQPSKRSSCLNRPSKDCRNFGVRTHPELFGAKHLALRSAQQGGRS